MQMPWEITDKRTAPVVDFDPRKITDHAIARYAERVREVPPGTNKQEILRCLAAAKPRHLRSLKRRRKKRTMMVPTGCCVFVFGRGGIMVTVLSHVESRNGERGHQQSMTEPKPRPTDCHQPIKCGWHKVRTEPDINYWSCDVPGCGHMARAL